jgi:BASS family bile acid:Na+ symporter
MAGSFLADVFVPAAMAALMIGVGTTLSWRDLADVGRTPRPLLAGLGAQLLGLPLSAAIALALPRPPPPIAIGVVLLAACPGGVFSNLMAHLARGRVALSVVLTATTTILGLATIPLWTRLAGAWLGLPVGELALGAALPKIAVMTALPVLVGVGLRAAAPGLCARLERPFSIASIAFLVGVAALILAGKGSEIAAAAAQTGPALVILALLSNALGYAAGRLAGVSPAERVTIALEAGIQNAALAGAIAITAFSAELAADVALPALVYLLLTFGPAAGWIAFGRRLSQGAARAAP